MGEKAVSSVWCLVSGKIWNAPFDKLRAGNTERRRRVKSDLPQNYISVIPGADPESSLKFGIWSLEFDFNLPQGTLFDAFHPSTRLRICGLLPSTSF
jgi:hypothetical protein